MNDYIFNLECVCWKNNNFLKFILLRFYIEDCIICILKCFIVNNGMFCFYVIVGGDFFVIFRSSLAFFFGRRRLGGISLELGSRFR